MAVRTAWLQGGGWKWVGRRRSASLAARTAADGVGAREWLEMGGEKKPLGMSELGCADGCGRRGCKGVAGNGWEAAGDERALAAGMGADGVGARERLAMGGEKKPLGMSELAARTAADGVGARGWLEMGWGEEGGGDERAWLWVQGIGWKWVGRRSRWG